METASNSAPLAATAGALPHQSQVCALIEDADDPSLLLAPFLRECLDRNEDLVVIAGSATSDASRRQLDASGKQACNCEAAGRLRFLRWTQLYGDSQAGFDGAHAIATLETELTSACAGSRHRPVRLVQQMDWLVSACGASPAVPLYERAVHELVSRYGAGAICVYDLSRLSGELLVKTLSIHPFMISRGRLVESPFYNHAS
jgi:hypothetical protein